MSYGGEVLLAETERRQSGINLKEYYVDKKWLVVIPSGVLCVCVEILFDKNIGSLEENGIMI